LVIRQRNGGATLAARLSHKDLTALQTDVDKIARSLTIVGAVSDNSKK